MRLGGHETFYPRPGWLAKGLLHLSQGHAGRFREAEIADSLGIGRNMARSLGWWLQATGLAESKTATEGLKLSELGEVIVAKDPYMARLGTWWLVHASTMTVRADLSLPWFFGPQRGHRLDRNLLIEDLSREITARRGKAPSLKSVQREVAVFLQTYAVPVPRTGHDPEDNLGSPLQRLSLLRHIRSADRLEKGEVTPAPPEVAGFLLSAYGRSVSDKSEPGERHLSLPANSPPFTRVASFLGLNREQLLQLVESGSGLCGPEVLSVRTHAGERVAELSFGSAADWARRYYSRLDAAARGDAA